MSSNASSSPSPSPTAEEFRRAREQAIKQVLEVKKNDVLNWAIKELPDEIMKLLQEKHAPMLDTLLRTTEFDCAVFARTQHILSTGETTPSASPASTSKKDWSKVAASSPDISSSSGSSSPRDSKERENEEEWVKTGLTGTELQRLYGWMHRGLVNAAKNTKFKNGQGYVKISPNYHVSHNHLEMQLSRNDGNLMKLREVVLHITCDKNGMMYFVAKEKDGGAELAKIVHKTHQVWNDTTFVLINSTCNELYKDAFVGSQGFSP